ncbi:hypothetical protein AALP_AA5G061800 [Arabis alpina]|uniref:Protein RALF-like 27 n=1 Tax=Arabis alpina TaxID=50452 RepID=A0A087GV96_ARAAL|nr:hypothetical protein AALP_AA5G061800 [Arabis alpina]
MAKSIFSFFFFIFSLLLLLEATSATASARNATSELRYGRCAPGVTVGECITAMHADDEEEGVEAVVRRILQQKKYLIPRGRQAVCNGKFVGDCIGDAYTKNPASCTYYDRCKRYGTNK